jgi:hypothetical protein
VSKVVMPLPEFPLDRIEGGGNDHFLARVELEAENVVGSYSHVENDVCIKALLNGGRLNHVLKKAPLVYAPRPQPGTEASTEVAKKRKVDASVKLVGKRVKVAGRKKIVVAPKAAAAPKAATVVAPETVAASAPKARAMPNSSETPTAAAVASKAAAVGQNGALEMAKVVPLKVKSGVKRPSDTELSLAKTVKESKMFSLASSSILVSTQRADIPSSLTPRSDDDDRVELILMMGVVSLASSSSSSSSSDSSVSESA